MPARPSSDVRAIAVCVVGLLLVSLVGLASGGSPWHADGRQGVPVGVVRALAAVAGALGVGALLLVWSATPSVAKRRRRRQRLAASDLEGLRGSLSASGSTAAIVCAAVGLVLLVTLPFLVPDAATSAAGATRADAAADSRQGASGPTHGPTAIMLRWAAIGSASALLLLAPAALLVRRRRARRDGRPVPDGSDRVRSGLRRSLDDLESELDPRLAVRRAYARMEEALGEIELSRASSETPAEYTARVLRVLGASAAGAADLTGLFEVARFSDHTMDEDDRRHAIASVRRVIREVAPR